MDISYFQKINNTYKSKSKQESELWLINRNEERFLYDNIDAQLVLLNNNPFELLVIKGTSDNNKKIKAKHDTPFNLGDYITWNNKIWLVTSIDSDDKTHHSGTMTLCTYIFRWQKKNGVIIERWAYIQDFEKYSQGTVSNGVLETAENSYGLTIPIDNETKLIDRTYRLVIDIVDYNDYENGRIPEVYRITNIKNMLSNNMYFNRGGIMTLTATHDSFNAQTDHYIDLGNGEHGWICGLATEQPITPSPTTPSDIIYSISGEDSIYPPYADKWTAVFTDKDNKPVEVTGWEFKVVADFDVNWDWQGDSITISVEKKYVGKKFTLQILEINSGKVLAEKKISVMGF